MTASNLIREPHKYQIHVWLPADLYHTLRMKAAERGEYGGVRGLVIRALDAYLVEKATGELRFEQVWQRDAPSHMPPNRLEKACSYAGRMGTGQHVAFFSKLLMYHHDRSWWNPATWWLIDREKEWYATSGGPALPLSGLPYPPSGWGDMPEDAQLELPPWAPQAYPTSRHSGPPEE